MHPNSWNNADNVGNAFEKIHNLSLKMNKTKIQLYSLICTAEQIKFCELFSTWTNWLSTNDIPCSGQLGLRCFIEKKLCEDGGGLQIFKFISLIYKKAISYSLVWFAPRRESNFVNLSLLEWTVHKLISSYFLGNTAGWNQILSQRSLPASPLLHDIVEHLLAHKLTRRKF